MSFKRFAIEAVQVVLIAIFVGICGWVVYNTSFSRGHRAGVRDRAAQMYQVIKEHPDASDVLYIAYEEGRSDGMKRRIDECDGIDTVYVIDGCEIDSLFVGTNSAFTIQNCFFDGTGMLKIDSLSSGHSLLLGAMAFKQDSTGGEYSAVGLATVSYDSTGKDWDDKNSFYYEGARDDFPAFVDSVLVEKVK